MPTNNPSPIPKLFVKTAPPTNAKAVPGKQSVTHKIIIPKNEKIPAAIF